MSAAVHVRFVTRGDYAEWLPLWQGYNAFYKRFGATALPDAVTQVTWARFFDTYEPMFAMVAELDGHLIGLVHYLWHRSTITIEPTCYLQDLFTAEAARGRGVGRALVWIATSGGLRAGSACGCRERLLADACYECDGSAAVRPGGGGVGLACVQEAA